MPQPDPPPAGDAGAQGAHLLNERYRLLDVVGEGGMAVVWRAEDTLLHRAVAVKVLREQYAADPEFLERFRTEARSAAALSHPGVVGVHDVGEADGRHYLVMEYVPGRDLKALIRDEAPLSPERSVEIALALADAVSAAHDAGMVHRDIKPQNVLVGPDGRMKVADFGIARAISAAGLTAPGLVMGTVHYIAPEQAAGAPATPASDVYSLGVVLYEMLTGRVPHVGDSSLAVAMKVMNETATPVMELNPQVPGPLAALLERTMAREPENRVPDANALAALLTAYRTDAGQVTAMLPQAGGNGRGSRFGRRADSPARSGRAPRLDWRGLGLGVVAVVAMAGLILVWMAAVGRLQGGLPAIIDPADASSRAPRDVPVAPVVPPTPTPFTEVEVPDVRGMRVEAARDLLDSINLSASEEPVVRQGAEVGRVVDQRPEPGTLVLEGSPVGVRFAAQAPISVPAVQLDPAAMAIALNQLGFIPQRRDIWRGAASPTQGQVIGLDPLPETAQPVGSKIIYNVDSGGWLPLGETFEDGVFLEGVQLVTDTLAAGQIVQAIPLWSAIKPISRDYEARMVVGDWRAFNGGAGVVFAEAARAPVDGRPTSAWTEGESITGATFELGIPADVPPDTYHLWIELFPADAPDLRLQVETAPMVKLGDRGVQIRPITVVAP